MGAGGGALKPVGWALAGAMAAVLLMTWCGRGKDAELEAAVARADSLRRVSDSLEAAHAADSAAAAVETARLADSLAAVDRQLESVTARATRLAGAIATSPDTLIPKREALAALEEKDAVIAAQATKISLLILDTLAWRNRWVQMSREARAWHDIAITAQDELSKANKRQRPGWTCVGGAGASVGVGRGAGLSVTCGHPFKLPRLLPWG